MDVDVISPYEAQRSADQQTSSAVIPLWEKTFTLNGRKVHAVDFINEHNLSPDQVEVICNLQIGESHNLSSSPPILVLKRVK